MPIVFKGTDLKQMFVVVKYKYKKRYFIPRWGRKDCPHHFKAQLFKSVAEAQAHIDTVRTGHTAKGHKYHIEPADNYFNYISWYFEKPYNSTDTLEITNSVGAVESVMKHDQKDMLLKAKQSKLTALTEEIGRYKIRIEDKLREIASLKEDISKAEFIRNELNEFDTESLAEKYKTKSEDMAAILFSGKDQY